MKYLISLILLFSCFSTYSVEDADFDKSSNLDFMRENYIAFDEPVSSSNAKLKLLRETYELNKPSNMKFNSTPLIPKKIHSIWIGNAPLPKNKQYYLETWRKFHPDWEIKLWTEEDLLKENFASTDLYLLAESYQEKSDIMRYEVVRRYGGLYIDSDIECFASFNELHHKYKFYGYMETPVINRMVVNILNGMFAAAPNHPILTQTLNDIRKNWDKSTLKFEQKYSTSEEQFHRSKHFMAVVRTMYAFGNTIYNFLEEKDHTSKIIIFPAGYGFPMYYINTTTNRNFLNKLFHPQKTLSYIKEIRPETLSFHYYEKENSLMVYQNFNKALFKQNLIPRKMKIYSKQQDKYFLNFKDLYDKNFPTEVNYEPIAQIPEIIYLYNKGNLSEQEFLTLKNEWIEKNKFSEIKVLTDAELEQFLPVKFQSLDPKIKKLLSRFYLLNKNGGIYVESNFKPINLQEFNYKYAFYGKLKNVFGVFDDLQMDLDFIASKPKHSIINNFINDVEKEISASNSIDNSQIYTLYLKNAYKYNQLDGKNILFPEAVFDQKR